MKGNSLYSSYSANVRRKPTIPNFISPAHFSTPVQFHTDTYAHEGIRLNVAIAARYSSDLDLASNCDVNLFEGDESPPGPFSRLVTSPAILANR